MDLDLLSLFPQIGARIMEGGERNQGSKCVQQWRREKPKRCARGERQMGKKGLKGGQQESARCGKNAS